MKAMWSAASGMKNLQAKIDTISNNLANVSTYGFKKQRVEFKDMMYDKITPADFKDDFGRPAPMEVGQGVMMAATTRNFGIGSMENTQNENDMAINGDGFFVVKDGLGNERYTKDGAFKISVSEGIAKLVTTEGYHVQGVDGDIVLGLDVDKIEVSKSGVITVTRKAAAGADNAGSAELKEVVGTFQLVRFTNPVGLEGAGGDLYRKTDASGEPILNEDGKAGEVWQGFIEGSNVQVVDEMIQMISAQRAYELNSKTIQTADRMLELAANLKR